MERRIIFANDNFVGGTAFMVLDDAEVARLRKELESCDLGVCRWIEKPAPEPKREKKLRKRVAKILEPVKLEPKKRIHPSGFLI